MICYRNGLREEWIEYLQCLGLLYMTHTHKHTNTHTHTHTHTHTSTQIHTRTHTNTQTHTRTHTHTHTHTINGKNKKKALNASYLRLSGFGGSGRVARELPTGLPAIGDRTPLAIGDFPPICIPSFLKGEAPGDPRPSVF